MVYFFHNYYYFYTKNGQILIVAEKINIKILVAPLDWGLGHATRCIPIITELLQLGCKVIIAAEGAQEKLLKKEFPQLLFVKLNGYRISYSNNKRFFSLKIILQLPKIIYAIQYEKKWLKVFLINTPVDAVIADNRYGLHSPGIHSVFITHQLFIKGSNSILEKILQKVNYILINKFSCCWVPDEKGNVNMAGALSHPKKLPETPVEYMGGLSRLNVQSASHNVFDLLFIISGPEPQRTLFEKKVVAELAFFKGNVMLVRGLPESEETLTVAGNITVKNHLPAKELEDAFCRSKLIISRSGYTTVMDICKLQKKAVLIPTPGQTEQEYLAKHLEKQGWCMAMSQEDFLINELLKQAENFEFKLAEINMESYKNVVNNFIKKLSF